MSLCDQFDSSTLKTLDACPVCEKSAEDSEPIAEDFIELFGERLYYTVDLCPACGLIYSRTRSQDDRLYTPAVDMEKEHGHQRVGLSALSKNVWNLQTKSQQVAEIINAMPRIDPVKYIEVGASDGMLYRMVEQRLGEQGRSLQATLVESTGAAEPCADIAGCTVVSQSFLEPFEAEGGGYDIAVLSHCLEHFDNPRAVVAKAYQLLAPGGVLYVEVPDGLRYDRCISTPLGYYHITNFNLLNLAWMIRDLGFTCVDELERAHYPGIRVIAKKSQASEPHEFSSRAVQLSRDALAFWRKVRAHAFSDLEGLEDQRLLVYGAGVHTIALFGQFPKWQGVCDVADSNPRLKTFLGQSVLPPKDLDFSNYDRVLISSYAYQNGIAEQLVSAGCDKDKLVLLYDEIFTYVA